MYSTEQRVRVQLRCVGIAVSLVFVPVSRYYVERIEYVNTEHERMHDSRMHVAVGLVLVFYKVCVSARLCFFEGKKQALGELKRGRVLFFRGTCSQPTKVQLRRFFG